MGGANGSVLDSGDASEHQISSQGVAGIIHNNLSPTERLIVEPIAVGEFANFWL